MKDQLMLVAEELICFMLLNEPSSGCILSLQSTYCKSFESIPGFLKPLNYPTPKSLTGKYFLFSGCRTGGNLQETDRGFTNKMELF